MSTHPADPADEHDDHPSTDPAGADHGAGDRQQPPADPGAARPPEADDQSPDGGDDPELTSDPLVLAHLGPATRAATTPPVPRDDPSPPSHEEDAEAAPAEPDGTADAPPPEAVDDLPPEDWARISHKGKSQFLVQRKTIATQARRLKAEGAARAQAAERYGTVERFVRDQGLSDEEYTSSVVISGLVKRGDPRVIPVLEATLRNVRRSANLPEQAAAAPELDGDLAELLGEAESLGIDTGRVRARFAARAPEPVGAPQRAQAQMQPHTQPQPHAQQHVTERGTGPAHAGHGETEHQAILQALTGLGVADPLAHVQGLMRSDPGLADTPPGRRLAAIMQAHAKAGATPPPAAPRTTGQPLSGRGRPALPVGGTDAAGDPLKLAIMPRGR